ncbi:hypothetical protein QYM36_011261, partial [Artemia franciscana]
MASTSKRPRETSNSTSGSDSEDNYVPYIPVKERKKQQLLKLGRITQVRSEETKAAVSSSETDGPISEDDAQALARKTNVSLLDQHTELKKIAQ